jgi:hypothetical protein
MCDKASLAKVRAELSRVEFGCGLLVDVDEEQEARRLALRQRESPMSKKLLLCVDEEERNSSPRSNLATYSTTA